MRRRKGLVLAGWILAGLVLVAAMGLGFIGNFFFNFALNPKAEVSFLKTTAMTATDWFTDQTQEVWMDSRDGLRVHGYYAPAEEGHKYAILCHGYGAAAMTMQRSAEHFYQLGYSVLMPDARASGKSGGDYIGMGWPERRDIVDWAKYLIARDGQARIALYGVSMGGATVMMASGERDLPEQVRCVIEDCGYSSAWDEFAFQLKDQYRLPPVPVLSVTSLVSRIRAGYWFGEASAAKQVAKSHTPTLFIHGDADGFVPFSMLDTVYQAAACPKEKLVVPGAGHALAEDTDPDLYWTTVEGFLSQYMV